METLVEKAMRLRAFMEKMSDRVDDIEILEAPEICKHWKAGEDVVEGDRRFYDVTQKLYKVREGKGHTTQENWTPDKTPDLWVVIALETEDGTLENPIEAVRGMEYEYGKYYRDIEDGKVYLCQREGMVDGTVEILQYMPHELVGMYFVLAE